MTEIHYMISDVSRILDIPANVLRYLEYHLSLNIQRTELGHRYYLQEDIDLLRAVKVLRDKGFHLKIIKSILPYINQVKSLDDDKLNDLRDRLEAALGLSGIEAQERVKAQYGKPVDIDMEEGDFVIKDPSTKQRTRLSAVKLPNKESISPMNGRQIELVVEKSQDIENEIVPPVNINSQVNVDVTPKSNHITSMDKNPMKKDSLSEWDSQKQPSALKPVSPVMEVSKVQVTGNQGIDKKVERRKVDKPRSKAKPAANVKEVRSTKKVSISKPMESNHSEVVTKYKESTNQPTDTYKEEVAVAKIEVLKKEEKQPKVIDLSRNESEGKNNQIHTQGKVKGENSTQNNHDKISDDSNSSQKQMLDFKSDASLLKASQDKIVQFREIMCSIVMDALSQNNHTLTNDINDAVTQSVVKEFDYRMKIKEEREEERFRQLDRTIRETQLQRQQAAATKEGKKKKPSKFFRKHNVRI